MTTQIGDATAKDMAKAYVKARATEATILAPLPTAAVVFTANMAKGKTLSESKDAVYDHFESTRKTVIDSSKKALHKTAEKIDEQPTIVKAMFGATPWLISGLDKLVN